jgi:hypothetical protein
MTQLTAQTFSYSRPQVYTELIGAELLVGGLTPKGGQSFLFGGMVCWIPKDHYKVENDKFYAAQWIAKKSIDRWNGEFVDGMKQMKSIDPATIGRMEQAAKLIKRGNGMIAQGHILVSEGLSMLENEPAPD